MLGFRSSPKHARPSDVLFALKNLRAEREMKGRQLEEGIRKIAKLREQNRRMIAQSFLEEFGHQHDNGPYRSPDKKVQQEYLSEEFSRIPGLLSEYASMARLCRRSKLRKLARNLDSEDPNIRAAAVQSLAMIMSDSEIYGKSAVVKASKILLKGRCEEAQSYLNLFAIKPDEISTFFSKAFSHVPLCSSRDKQSLKDVLSERGLIPQAKKTGLPAQPVPEY